jgi:hypothetical protein
MSDMPGAVLAHLVHLLKQYGGAEAADDLLLDWRFPFDLEDLGRRYAAYPEMAYDPALVAWLLARYGTGDPSGFEFALGSRIGFGRYVLPVWVLSRPASGARVVRLPADPVILPIEPPIDSAYRGLLDHLATYDHDSALELQRTSVAWRVGAIADGIEPADESRRKGERALAKRIDGLVIRLQQDGRLTSDDELLLRSWAGSRFSDRRNVLTHLRCRSIDFAAAIDHYADFDALLTECAAISIAVLNVTATVMREASPPTELIERTIASVEWIDP